jgi:hypothetical protein
LSGKLTGIEEDLNSKVREYNQKTIYDILKPCFLNSVCITSLMRIKKIEKEMVPEWSGSTQNRPY